jgi:hypothetical protein
MVIIGNSLFGKSAGLKMGCKPYGTENSNRKATFTLTVNNKKIGN